MAADIRVTRFALTTSVETQDVTIAGAGQCRGYVLFPTTATTNDTEHATMSVGIGFCDSAGAVQSIDVSCRDGDATQSQSFRENDNDLMNIYVGDLRDATAQHSAFISDGFRINVTSAPAEAFFVEAWVFYGGEVTTVATEITTSTNNGQEVTVNVGQRSHLALFANSNSPTAGSSNHAHIGLGVASYTGGTPDQAGTQQYDTDNVATSESYCAVFNNRVGCELRHGPDGTPIHCLECTTISDTEIGLTNRENTGGGAKHFIVYSVNLGPSSSAKVGAVEVPTSGGNQAYTGTGFRPQFVGMFLTNINGYIDETSGSESSGFSLYVGAADGTNEYSNGGHSEDGVTTTNTGSYSNDSIVGSRDFDGTTESEGTLVSFDSDGWTVNYTTNPPTAWDGFYVAIQEDLSTFPFSAIKSIKKIYYS